MHPKKEPSLGNAAYLLVPSRSLVSYTVAISSLNLFITSSIFSPLFVSLMSSPLPLFRRCLVTMPISANSAFLYWTAMLEMVPPCSRIHVKMSLLIMIGLLRSIFFSLERYFIYRQNKVDAMVTAMTPCALQICQYFQLNHQSLCLFRRQKFCSGRYI